MDFRIAYVPELRLSLSFYLLQEYLPDLRLYVLPRYRGCRQVGYRVYYAIRIRD